MNEDTQQILIAIRNNDEASFKKLFDEYYDALYYQAFRLIGDQQIAEELTQDAFVRFWQSRQSIQIQTSIKAYLAVSVKNLAFNHLKSKYAKYKSLEEDILDIDPPQAEDFQSKAAVEELAQILNETILNLPEKCRIVFQMSRLQGLSYQEIADELGIGKETVKSQIKVALKKLKISLKDHPAFAFLLLLWQNL